MHNAEEAFRTAVLAALGHAPGVIEPGRLQRFATNGRRGDSAGWCLLFPDLRAGVYGCHRSGISETWTAMDRTRMTRQERAAFARQVAEAAAQREAEQRAQWAQARQRNADLWAQCLPLERGDPVARYLRRRGFDVWPLPSVLRLHPALPYWQGSKRFGTFPAMLAPLTAPDGRVVALHRTYLTQEGRKADVPSVKKLTAASGPLAGASIALHAPQRGVAGIAEGIETALAASLGSGIPTAAAYCAGSLAAWQWPAGVQRVVIFADGDTAGRAAADALRVRVLAARLKVEVLTPTDDGSDWADVWAQRGAVTVEGTTP